AARRSGQHRLAPKPRGLRLVVGGFLAFAGTWRGVGGADPRVYSFPVSRPGPAGGVRPAGGGGARLVRRTSSRTAPARRRRMIGSFANRSDAPARSRAAPSPSAHASPAPPAPPTPTRQSAYPPAVPPPR